eukprot:g13723.t1
MSDQSTADHGGGSATQPGAANLVESSQVVDETAEKIERVRNAPKLAKPANARHPVWKHFKVYQSTRLAGKAICQLCYADENFESAEVKFTGGSPTNLMNHLDTKKPKHREAYGSLKKAGGAGGRAPSAAAAAAAAAGAGGKMTSFFKVDGNSWHNDLVRLIVNHYLSLSFVDYSEFQTVVSALNKKAKAPTRRAMLDKMREVKASLENEVALMLDDEYVAITTDGWTSRSNESYMSLTVAYIDVGWQLRHLSLNCTKHTGSTQGEDLAREITSMIESHGLTGRVMACVTDCEPSMVKAGRLLESLGALAKARALVGRYKRSSQMSARLVEILGILKLAALAVLQDVETRWWSSWAMVERLLYLMKAIKLHESTDNLAPVLSETDWEVLRLVEPILRPFMQAQKDLEGAKYVTGSMTVPKIGELRDGLEAAIADLKATDQLGIRASTKEAMEAVLPDAEALWEDFLNRWGDGSNILEYREGKRRQPQGFKLQQVCATAVDPRAKHLYGIRPAEHASVWRAVATKAVDIAAEKFSSDNTATSRSAPAAQPVGTPPVAPGGQGAPKRARLSAFEAAAAAHAGVAASSAGRQTLDEKREQLASIVDLEVAAFQTTPGISMWYEGADGKKVYNDPLDWWRTKQMEFPHLAALARRVLAIPSSQAQSERVFSTAGLTVTAKRTCLSDDNVELLVHLKNVWGVVDEWQKSVVRQKKVAK